MFLDFKQKKNCSISSTFARTENLELCLKIPLIPCIYLSTHVHVCPRGHNCRLWTKMHKTIMLHKFTPQPHGLTLMCNMFQKNWTKNIGIDLHHKFCKRPTSQPYGHSCVLLSNRWWVKHSQCTVEEEKVSVTKMANNDILKICGQFF